MSTVRAFDPNSGRLRRIDTVKGAVKLQENEYGWQSNGILKSRISGSGAGEKAETFTYDALDRLRSAVTKLGGSGDAARMLSMTYDRLGNLRSKSSSITEDTGASNYLYGTAATELSSVSIGGVGHTLAYDDWGRVKTYDRAGTATEDRYVGWNARHLATTVTVGDSLGDATPKAKDEFLYGPDGQRYYKKSTWEVPGADATTPPTYAVEHTYYAGTHREVIRQGDTENRSVATSPVSATVLHVKTTPVSGPATTAFEYLHRDHLGSVESVTDAAGDSLKVQAYDPFGSRRAKDWKRALNDDERKALAGEAPQRTARGYTGHEHLERTGLIHMNGRVYDPAIGRFLSPDPVVADASFSQSWNAYSYAMNSPLSYSDPSGLTLVGGCPPSVCAGGGFGGGHGGFGPSSVLANSWHRTVGVGVIWSFGYGFGLPNLSIPSRMINIQDRSADGSARGGNSLENRPWSRYPTLTPRLFLVVSYQRLSGWVGIGEEQSPADTPIELLASGAVFVADFVILDTIRSAQGVYYDISDEKYGSAAIGVASVVCDVAKACKILDKGFGLAKKAHAARAARPGPAPNQGIAKPHGGPAHDGAIDRRIEELKTDPSVTNIRKNQVQVDVEGRRVGNNRPDVQFDRCGIHHCVEYDTRPRNSVRHGQVIQQRDPNAVFEPNQL